MNADDAWFAACQAWRRAALATPEQQRDEHLLERAHRLNLKARAADPERAAQEDIECRMPDSGELFDELKGRSG